MGNNICNKFFLIGFGGGRFFVSVKKNNNNASSDSISGNENVDKSIIIENNGDGDVTTAGAMDEKNINLNGEFNRDDWEITDGVYPEIDKNGKETGFFCVEKSRKFISKEIWYKKDICKGDMIVLKYQIKMKEADAVEPPMLYISFGKTTEERIYRFVLPDKDRIFIGMENNSKRGDKFLTRKIKCPVSLISTAENSIEIETFLNSSGEIIFDYTFYYHTDDLVCEEEHKPLSSPNNFSMKSIWHKGVNEKNPLKVGVGVQNEACFRITNFKIKQP